MAHYQILDVFQRILRPLTRIFRRVISRNSERLQIDVFPKFSSVEQWYIGLIHVAWLPRKELAVLLRDKCLVKKLYLCNSSQASSSHEYLVAEVSTPDGMLVGVRIDRVQGESRSPPPRRVLSNTVPPRSASPSPSSSVLSRRSSRSSIATTDSDISNPTSQSTRRAQDTVHSYLDPSTPRNVAQRLVFKAGREPRLLDLVFIVFAAHEFDNTYKIFGPQCNWYSICIYEVLKGLVGEGGYQEKTLSSQKLERTPSRTDSIIAGVYFPGDVAQPQPTPRGPEADATAVDPALPSLSPHQLRANYNPPVSRTPRKDVINSVRQNYDRFKVEFESMERDRVQEQVAHAANRAARIAAEQQVVQLEAEARRHTEAIEALRAEVARLQAADNQNEQIHPIS